MRRTFLTLSLVLVTGLVAVACDDSGNPGVDARRTSDLPCSERSREGGDFPVTIEAANGAVEIAERPVCIVSLSPASTEILFALGAGSQVVAVDDQSDFPPEAPRTDLSGFTPNIEAIAGYEPDLVVAANDLEDLVSGLDRLGIPVLLHPAAATLDDTYRQIEDLGTATGHPEEASELVAGMQEKVEELVAGLPEIDPAPSYYHELDDNLYTVTSSTFIGQIYALAGLRNVADAADADGGAGGYPQLSPEYLVEQDPDVIFFTDCCGQTPESLRARPGWSQLTAVQEGRLVELDSDVASRWGPRVVEFLRAVSDAVHGLAPQPGEDDGDDEQAWAA